MSDEDDTPERRCVDCRRPAPEQASEYTLISSRYGWRLTKATSTAGETVLEWRCSECFAQYRTRAGALIGNGDEN
jgi:hypothetical protein